ncbi:hypothetical protein pipiens_000653, partial [Culex pipiens pipiens]
MNESDEHTLCAVPYRDKPTKSSRFVARPTCPVLGRHLCRLKSVLKVQFCSALGEALSKLFKKRKRD